MIHTRHSEDSLTKDVLLSKVSEYQIFKYYCSTFQELNKKFKSDLRKDNNPTVSIALINGRLRYTDFGYPEQHSFDCFSYISYKYKLNFRETLRHIDGSFNLGLSGGVHIPRAVPKMEEEPTLVEHVPAAIKVKLRNWDKEDATFWKQFNISKRILCIFDVLPITHYWINEKRFSCGSISYRYRFDCGYKIYRPLEADFKWSSNVGSSCVQGYNQLPKTGGEIFLTSSLKDIMCLAMLGYPSIALQSEMLMPSDQTIEEIQTRFKEVIVLYDNDYHKSSNPGQTMAKKICRKFGLLNLCIPDKYKSKDISDLVKHHSLKEAQNVIKNVERTSQERRKDKVEANGSGRDQIPF
jgi:5S rRNA maturation endonuclease (ribonuclease M5)